MTQPHTSLKQWIFPLFQSFEDSPSPSDMVKEVLGSERSESREVDGGARAREDC